MEYLLSHLCVKLMQSLNLPFCNNLNTPFILWVYDGYTILPSPPCGFVTVYRSQPESPI